MILDISKGCSIKALYKSVSGSPTLSFDGFKLTVTKCDVILCSCRLYLVVK